jgi:hypothetical protein
MEDERSVYVTYRAEDGRAADELAELLAGSGFSVVRGASRAPGRDVRDEVASSIAVVALVGRRGPAPHQAAALQAGTDAAVPVYLVPLDADLALPRELAGYRVIDIHPTAEEEGEGLAAVARVLRWDASQAAPPHATKTPAVELSDRLRLAVAGLHGPVTAGAVAGRIFEVAPDVGSLAGGTPPAPRPGARTQPVEAWLEEVGRLYPAWMTGLGSRRAVLGLARVERSLWPDESVLKPLYEHAERIHGAAALAHVRPLEIVDEGVLTQTDSPALVDALQREGLARVIANRIRVVRARDDVRAAREPAGDADRSGGRSFLILLDGRWGSGKTTVLNFLRRELVRPDVVGRPTGERAYGRWIVVTFNAWQHQRIVPPWWWLMTAVQRQGTEALPRASVRGLSVRWWIARRRIAAARWWIVLAALVLGGGIALASAIAAGRLSDADSIGKVLALATSAVAFVGAVGAASRRSSQSIVSTSGRGAKGYIEQTSDPMQAARRHFEELVRRLELPVAIFVDDLDRCKAANVVELLEGIQTLFRDVPVTYVVAADRAWLSHSFFSEYRSFVAIGAEPGRPFGLQFLEKTFQLTTRLPRPSAESLSTFWRGLISTADDGADLDEERRRADLAFRGLRSAASVHDELERNPGDTPAEQQARREAAAIQLADPAIEEETEHALWPFQPLVGWNPRELKRLVNAYGIARDLDILARGPGAARSVQHRTALWTILNLRWPELGDYLAHDPAALGAIGNGAPPADAPDRLRPLFADPEVIAVVRGDAPNVHAQLDERAVRELVGLAAGVP